MNIIKNMILFLLLLIPVCGFSNGTIVNDVFYSDFVGLDRNVRIYLPEGYDPEDTDTEYPVIYFLHGGGMDYDDYGDIATALDTLINVEIDPVILVRPSGYYGPYSGMSWWSDSDLNGNFESFVVYELIDYMETLYNVSTDRSKRCLIGHSMGGYGAMMIALKHPDIYRGIVSHSGVVNSTVTVQEFYVPTMLTENGGEGPFDPGAGGYTVVMYSLAAAFTPNLDNPPYFLDLPVDDDGNYLDEVFDQWILEDPAWLATQLDTTYELGIYVDACIDEGGFPYINECFTDTLDLYNIPYKSELFPGAHHHYDLPPRYPAALSYLDSVMKVDDINKIEDHQTNLPETFRIERVYPNPFNSRLNITIALPDSEQLKLDIFDIQGRKVATIAEDRYQPGYSDFSFDAGDLPSGIYFLQAHVPGKFKEILKVIFLK